MVITKRTLNSSEVSSLKCQSSRSTTKSTLSLPLMIDDLSISITPRVGKMTLKTGTSAMQMTNTIALRAVSSDLNTENNPPLKGSSNISPPHRTKDSINKNFNMMIEKSLNKLKNKSTLLKTITTIALRRLDE